MSLGTQVNYTVQVKLIGLGDEAKHFERETHSGAHAVLSSLGHRTVTIGNRFCYKQDRFIFSTPENETEG